MPDKKMIKKDSRDCMDKRRCILDAASVLFAERDFHEVKVDDIAARAGLSKGTIYLYFSSKEDLFFSIIKDRTADLHEALRAAVAADESFDVSLRRFIQSYLAFFDRHRSCFKIMQSEKLRIDNERHHNMHVFAQKSYQKFIGIIIELMHKGINQQKIREMEPEIAAMALRGILSSFSFERAFIGSEKTIEQETENIIDVLLSGIR